MKLDRNVLLGSVLVLVGFACAPLVENTWQQTESQHAVVNGTPASIDDGPGSVALIVSGVDINGTPVSETFCTGTLIAPDVVLTAAHCFDALPPARLAVTREPNMQNRATAPDDAIDIADVVLHPDHNGTTNKIADVALLFLATPAPFAPPILLQPEEVDYLQPGQKTELIGWGRIQKDGTWGIKQMGQAELNFVGAQSLIVGFRLPDLEQSQTCKGDSGGPLYIQVNNQTRMIGVHSRTSGCAEHFYEARADAFIDFYDAELRARCEDGRRSDCSNPGLPTPAELGGTLLPPAPKLDGRRVPDSLDGLLRETGAHMGQCLGWPADQGTELFTGLMFGFGEPLCTTEEIQTGAALLQCLSDSCDAIYNETCVEELHAAGAAVDNCSSSQGTITDSLIDEVIDAVNTYCYAQAICGLDDVAGCRREITFKLRSISGDCKAAQRVYAENLLCKAQLNCRDQSNETANDVCSVGLDDRANAALDDCNRGCGNCTTTDGTSGIVFAVLLRHRRRHSRRCQRHCKPTQDGA